MAAPLGFKTFTVGEVLSAADVNGYLMQGVLVFATTAARDAAITSPQEGQFAFTKDTNSLFYYDGAAWVASGATGDIEGVTAGTGISGGGTSGTVTVTNSMATAIDAKGDLIVGTGADTFSRLAVGTNTYTLVADSAEATGLKWAAPAGGSGLTLIDEIAVSSSGTINVDNVFTSTYKNYRILIVAKNTTNNNMAEGTMKMRASSTDTSSGYNSQRINAASTTVSTSLNAYGTDEWYIASFSPNNAGDNGFSMDIYAPQLAKYTSFQGVSFGTNNEVLQTFGTLANTTQYDGFTLLFANAITGAIFVYGYAKE